MDRLEEIVVARLPLHGDPPEPRADDARAVDGRGARGLHDRLVRLRVDGHRRVRRHGDRALALLAGRELPPHEPVERVPAHRRVEPAGRPAGGSSPATRRSSAERRARPTSTAAFEGKGAEGVHHVDLTVSAMVRSTKCTLAATLGSPLSYLAAVDVRRTSGRRSVPRVLVEPAPALAAEQARLDHPVQQRRGDRAGIAELLVQRLATPRAACRARSGPPARSGPIGCAQPSTMPRSMSSARREARLVHPDRRQQVGDQQRVDHEAGAVLGVDALLAERLLGELARARRRSRRRS